MSPKRLWGLRAAVAGCLGGPGVGLGQGAQVGRGLREALRASGAGPGVVQVGLRARPAGEAAFQVRTGHRLEALGRAGTLLGDTHQGGDRRTEGTSESRAPGSLSGGHRLSRARSARPGGGARGGLVSCAWGWGLWGWGSGGVGATYPGVAPPLSPTLSLLPEGHLAGRAGWALEPCTREVWPAPKRSRESQSRPSS